MELPQPTNAPVAGKSGHGKGNRGIRTVYMTTGDEHSPALKPVQIRTGITDGIFTEVTEGLNENDKIVNGTIGGDSSVSSGGSSPFGGGGFPRR